jgi:hypothetical protein
MKEKEIKEYLGKETLLITKDNFHNYGLIESVDNDATRMKTRDGKVSFINESIRQIREVKVIW